MSGVPHTIAGDVADHITVKGQLHIGLEHVLKPSVEAAPAEQALTGDARPPNLPFGKTISEVAPSGELAMRRISYGLKRGSNEIYIRNKGMVTSYGIFGAPGSGKTHLLTYLLYQIFDHEKNNPAKKYGGLILDPKASLIKDIRAIATQAGRVEGKDFVVLNTDELTRAGEQGYVNVIGIGADHLDPYELGKQLVLAARSAGVTTSDTYWLLAWGNLFGAALYLLSQEAQVPTMRRLLDAVLTYEQNIDGEKDKNGKEVLVRRIQNIARRREQIVLSEMSGAATPEQQDILNAASEIATFFSQKNDSVATIEAIITNAYSPFQRSRYRCFSRELRREHPLAKKNFYDEMIEDGKIVLVSLSPSEPGVAKTLCTLVKCLFQRSVLSRKERVRAGKLKNFERPLVLACDEYSQVASEVPGEPLGDGYFFSLSRENGCMGLIATQSVNVLEASSLKESWRSVFSNMSAKIFMRLVDNETVEEATKLAGELEVYLTSESASQGRESSFSRQTDRREIKALPSRVPTQVFRMGDGVILGSLDGSASESLTRFVHVPGDKETFRRL